MKKLIAILLTATVLAACNNSAGDQAASGANVPLASFDACSCVKVTDATSADFIKCRDLRRADPKFEADFQQCALAAKSGLDTNQVKLRKGGDVPGALSIKDGSFIFDGASSKVIWRGEKATGKKHQGSLNVSEGAIILAGGNISSGAISIAMNTIKVTGEDAASASKLETHLKSDDFFATQKHPSAKFEVISATAQSPQSFVVKGNLTIKGITKEATANLVVVPSGDNVVIGGSLMFDRAAYDVRYGSDNFFQNLGNDLIKDEIMLTFDLKANKK